ncbi:FAD:protein FMN transferase [Photobacterium angustum]|uniref:FAD:protein FMN transferase n=1 Tax=Photobacterium angustum TaxID=661 RepID=A0A855SAF5_PHOAN|nr:FAD:protein FMN transferase [Photobacterium angustum]KJF79988.1 thiamine biosynthesis protein ApbE [Photobacterium damselae subsp. damselae]KJG01498.1 thiamine biosynthesis protein ApbE [Photobacterium angustum]KJG05566.1 thiamine biosynthesis protein ApbE [Photobacterium angustum]KJG30035.1 thiamine biosynthesis protein ApbE [Photobacterium angustum]KJG40109.1 thiamine biosynthesis protein ApbE [Photobacterium angustum]
MFTKTSNVFLKRSCAALFTLSATMMLSGCSEPPKLEKIAGYAEGTSYHVSYWSKDDVSSTKVKAQFDKALDAIDKEYSTYRGDSYISKFNKSTSTEWQPASKDFIYMLSLAKAINKESHGCYDPTIQPLYKLWGFQSDKLNVPTAAEIAKVRADIGIDKIEIDPEHLRIRKTIPQLQVDLSSMGEGYAISRLSQILESDGVENYLVEFGGDMKIKGHKPMGEKWRVAIEQPVALKDGIHPYQIVTINDENGVSLNTSGTYHHNFKDGKKDYSHILDARTGAPITHDLVSASVFGNDPIQGDAWATTMLCLGPDEGKAVANEESLPVYYIQDVDDAFKNSKSNALIQDTNITLSQHK